MKGKAAILAAWFAAAPAAAGPSPLPAAASLAEAPLAAVPFDLAALKQNWRQRIDAIRSSGILPVIDFESSLPVGKVNLQKLAREMDEGGLALIAFSAEGEVPWSDGARRAVGADTWRYIPASAAGNHPAWTRDPPGFLQDTIARVGSEGYPMMGEFEFRHYPSPRQVKRGETFRDVNIPIDGELGQRLFAFSETSGVPFQIHYEIEDALLSPLETMLRRYPSAKVVWCHLAQVRYQGRATAYGPAYVRRLIEAHPNLYFDVAFGGPDSVYPPSGERHARVWDAGSGKVRPEWSQLIADHPWRFLAALDLGGDRMDRVPEYIANLRRFLDQLPPLAREIVAYKAGWKLLFGEDI